ncbi:hypothetical protein [Hymenobacter weizhouensis]|uniref:hypothetical protein n=1 Tax=Hymenobacter sp. YIM 151500-1 TaxID=2987689 RepID=UPI002225CB22|nr:hypothetical protein [Hymenobacter sp. YIM 151500-1]UYZ64284.1 hypothetical protein OIS53_05400 [Hymenobacter sp. YIM 151500-1]
MESQYSSVQNGGATKIETQVLISSSKFILLCLLTCGLYALYWQYKAWRFLKQWQQSDIWPAVRAIFSIFTVYELLKTLQRFANRQSIPADYRAGNLAAGYIILSLLSRLPDPFWLISLLAFACLLPAYNVFTTALLVSEEVQAVEQPGFNTRQWLLIGVFGLFWLLALWGLTLPETEVDISH